MELLSSAQLCGSMPSTNRFGSNPGFETKASTPPLSGSIATSAPRRSPNAFSATCCSIMSSVSATLFPGCEGVRDSGGNLLRPAASISTRSKPVVPCSSCW